MSSKVRIVVGPIAVFGFMALRCQSLELVETHRLYFNGGGTRSLAFTPDDRFLACGGGNGDVAIYEIATRRRVLDLAVSYSAIKHCVFSPDATRLVIGSHDLSLWSFPKGELLGRWKSGIARSGLVSMAVAPSGRWLAYHDGEKILVKDTYRLTTLARIGIQEMDVYSMRFSPSEDNLILDDTAIWPWSKAGSSWTMLQSLKEADDQETVGHGGPQESLPFVWENNLTFVDGETLVWFRDMNRSFKAKIGSLAVSANAKVLAVSTSDGSIALFNEAWNLIRRTGNRGAWPVMAPFDSPNFAVSSSGDMIATPASKGGVTILKEGKQTWFPGNALIPKSVAWDPSGRFLAVRLADEVVSVDLQTGLRRNLGECSVFSAGWQPGEFLLAMTKDGKTELRRVLASSGEVGSFRTMEAPQDAYRGTALLASPAKGDALYATDGPLLMDVTKGGMVEFHPYRLLMKAGGTKGFQASGVVLDAAWSRKGEDLILVTEKARSCGISRRGTAVMIYRRNGKRVWDTFAQGYRPKGLLLTGDLSPSNKRVCIGGTKGILTYARTAPDARIHTSSIKEHVEWLRYLNEDLLLAHDGQVVSLWKLKGLKRIAISDPLGVPKAVRRASFPPTEILFMGNYRAPRFIHGAGLSPDRGRLALVGNWDVRILDITIR